MLLICHCHSQPVPTRLRGPLCHMSQHQRIVWSAIKGDHVPPLNHNLRVDYIQCGWCVFTTIFRAIGLLLSDQSFEHQVLQMTQVIMECGIGLPGQQTTILRQNSIHPFLPLPAHAALHVYVLQLELHPYYSVCFKSSPCLYRSIS